MDSISVKTSTNEYAVSIGPGLRFQMERFINKSYSKIFIITDSNVEPLYLPDVLQSLEPSFPVNYTVVPAGESSKSARVYFDIITEVIQSGLDRDSLIIALGGGMVGDLAGFVAATFMRGIDFIQMPTTILAHDSSVGGKVAINHPEGKNLIGSFYPPQAVVYDVDTLHTIPLMEIRSGYAEIVKHSFIHDQPFWEDIEEVDLTKPLLDDQLMNHLFRGIQVKANIVELDEKESNIRQYLNFGHTLGHALESELGYGKLTHGEAVAIGMLFAIKVSEAHFHTELPYQSLFEWLKRNHYPIALPPTINVNNLINRMKKDKKAKKQSVQMVLLRELGEPITESIEDFTLIGLLEQFLRELVDR
ncbi:3-dehydroquinate synthase [Natronobacillus azotifigens]|uniref:3-dehydroquinate synthase n=1 Tax=Natronobacillus azotifigens TaxID=472978 RepID=A0A9J6R922_9BACI|nr:3-dehydroquinate synthase [Natronobacillus azotifigens]MCZ0701862.1 3-dehydroquinate synthase [Natronobacillus azotifigens]